MKDLERVDLRDINYANHFDVENMNGVEVPPDSPEEENAYVERRDGTTATILERPSEIEVRQGRPLSAEELRMLTANDLGDNGVRVERQQWLLWERWAVSRDCDSLQRHAS
jgi:hypothetical protein